MTTNRSIVASSPQSDTVSNKGGNQLTGAELTPSLSAQSSGANKL
jgi:hypothetical protein